MVMTEEAKLELWQHSDSPIAIKQAIARWRISTRPHDDQRHDDQRHDD